MYSNLSIAMAQEHHRDLRRGADTARLANRGAPVRLEAATPPFARISFAWTVRRPAHKFAITTAEPGLRAE
jgi:hypothetical protein